MANAPGAGRPPKPTAIRVLEGNPGKRPLNDAEPKPKVGLPSCPAHLSPLARREWRRMGRVLADLGVMTEIDGAVLASYCQAWADWCEAQQHLRSGVRFGESINAAGTLTIVESPWAKIAREAEARFMRAASEFGMTPSARSRVRASQPEADADEFEEMMNRGRRRAT